MNDAKDGLDVTAYRGSVAAAENWKDTMVARGGSTCLLLRRDETSWIVYGRGGAVVGESDDVISKHIEETTDVVSVDRSTFERSTREALFNEDLSLIACAEGHAGASAADHSNIAVMCRRMIVEASAEDLKHIFLVDSHQWPCRVLGLFADLSRLSGEMTDVFIDRSKWLKSSWPLMAKHHITTLADRLTNGRQRFVMDLLAECADAASFDRILVPGLQAAWMCAGPSYRYRFALFAVETLRDGILFSPRTPEVFSPEVVALHAKDLLKAFREMMP